VIGSQQMIPLSTLRTDQSIQFSHQIRTVLNQKNYLFWKSYVLPVLRRYVLVGFIDEFHYPPPIILPVNGVNAPNSTYAK
jgi:hypothetical protein